MVRVNAVRTNMTTTKEKLAKWTILVWNDDEIRVVHVTATETVVDDVVTTVREALHGGGADDPRWQLLDGHLQVHQGHPFSVGSS
jgi:hypothetical protein